MKCLLCYLNIFNPDFFHWQTDSGGGDQCTEQAHSGSDAGESTIFNPKNSNTDRFMYAVHNIRTHVCTPGGKYGNACSSAFCRY